MKIILFLIITIIITNTSFADLIKPNPNINSQDVIKIQLNALKQNNEPYENAGIEQDNGRRSTNSPTRDQADCFSGDIGARVHAQAWILPQGPKAREPAIG